LSVTKKADMSSRYAAAHARREQRRREVPTREYLPLAEETAPLPVPSGGLGGRLRATSSAPALTSRLPAIDYSYLRADLLRTATLAVSLFAIMVVLSFIIK
jgi:hypothetical protein